MAKTSFVKPSVKPTASAAKPTTPAARPVVPAAKAVVPAARPVAAKPVARPAAVAPKPIARPVVVAKPIVARPAAVAPRPAPRSVVRQPDPEPVAVETVEVDPENEAPVNATEAMEEAQDQLAETGITSALATQAPGQVSGEVDSSDFELPDLKLAQAVGPLGQELGFSAGQLVLKRELAIWSPEDGEPLQITVLKLKKQFIEHTEWGSDVMPRVFDTLQEVKNNGGYIEWVGNERPPFEPMAVALILIKKPDHIEDVAGHFNLEHESGLYSQAIWRLQGQGYKYAARKIITESRLRLKEGLFLAAFDLTALLVKGKLNSYWVPQLKNGALHDQSFVDFVLANHAG